MNKGKEFSLYKSAKEISDPITSIQALKGMVEGYVSERDWAKFHSPKNLAMAIGVEAGELMDLFRWQSEKQSVRDMKNGKLRRAAADEIADIQICLLAFANRTGINLSQIVYKKIQRIRKKYPPQYYKGRS